ncbi:hypothetical protein [Micromonospora echinaurantiaca]|uniref:hypothetical protein n=1 Tax=Micromonospora echinaurantiaca TaxID=47857 RepID=UPI0037B721DA
MRRIRSFLGVLAAGACATALLPGMALAAPTAPYTALTVNLGEHAPLSVGRSAAYDDSSAKMRVERKPGGSFLIEAVVPSGTTEYRTNLVTAPPFGGSWEVGRTYPTAPVADVTHAQLDLTSTARYSCAESTGSITVQELRQDASTGAVDMFAARYRFTCAGQPSPISGEIRYNSSLDYVAAVPDRSRLSFEPVRVGESGSTSVEFSSAGSVGVQFGAASLGGTDPGAVTISEDTCSGRVVAPGSSCRVALTFRPDQLARRTALLQLPDNGPAGRQAVPIEATVTDGVKGTYYPVSPARLLDTRSGLGGHQGKLGPDSSLVLQVAGRAGVPGSGVAAAVLNVTVTGPTASSFLTVYPAGEARPTASSVNFAKDWLGSNNVTVQLDSRGRISIYNRAGSTHVVVDVVGFHHGASVAPTGLGQGGQYRPVAPVRLFDSRTDHRGALPAGAALNDWVDFAAFGKVDYNSHVKALVLNITAVQPLKDGFLTAWSGEGATPEISTVNYRAGKVVPNLAYVTTHRCPLIRCGMEDVARYMIYSSATTHLVVDLVGVIDDGLVADGLRFRANGPVRIVDSRIGMRLRTLSSAETGRVDLAGNPPPGLIDGATQVLATNVTAVTPEKNTVITVWPADAGMAKPASSNLNPQAGQIVSNGVLVGLGPRDAFHVHNLTGRADVVVDVVGSFYLYPGTASAPGTAVGVAGPKVAAVGDAEYALR